MKTVQISDLEFDVTADGQVHQPQSVPGQVLDEVRLQAASMFLGEPRLLTREQREYWAAVRTTTPEHKRFSSIRGVA